MFDNIRHDYLMEMVKAPQEKWIPLYIEKMAGGTIPNGEGTIVKGHPSFTQGRKLLIESILANLFLHYVFDDFMEGIFQRCKWAEDMPMTESHTACH